jgi:hypothetical protein
MELKVPCSDGQISGQYKPTQNILAMFLFDLQIAAFLVLKNGKFIAAILTLQRDRLRI